MPTMTERLFENENGKVWELTAWESEVIGM